MPRTPENVCVPFAEWPSADRQAWLRAEEPLDLFDPAAGQAKKWSAATLKMIASGYGRWVGWLQLNDNLNTQEQPGARATRERVRAYLAALKDANLADYTISRRMQELSDAMKLMAPEEDFGWIARGASRLHSEAQPARDLRPRLRPADEVLQLGLDMMHAAENDRFRQPVDRACLFRDGLVITFLTLRPIRSKNLTALTIGAQLVRRGAEWWVEVTEEEGKNKRALEFPWPVMLGDALNRYLAVHRQALLKCARRRVDPGEALWISKQGTAMTDDALSFQVKGRTRDEFGEPINLHSFRHIAATTIATIDPENATWIAAILGHTTTRSSDKHYNRARAVDAGRRYQDVLTAVRGSFPVGRRRICADHAAAPKRKR